jgi:predicted RNase H-like nuclease
VSHVRVLGADACPGAWIGIAVCGCAGCGSDVRAYVDTEIESLVLRAGADGPLSVVGIDMPIGLADSGLRRADVLARSAAGPRWQSVFMAPVRSALLTSEYALAVAENRRCGGGGISRQAFGLRAKIGQVDRWLRTPPADLRVVEVHPELSFGAMAGAPLPERKSTWAGVVRRRQLLADQGIVLPGDLGEPGRFAKPDDVLDAAAVAWTALRVARGDARCLPDPPERFSDGIECSIWS